MAENSADKIAQLFSFLENDGESAFTKIKLKEILEKSVGESIPQEEIDKLFEEMKTDDSGKVTLSNFVSTMLNKENIPDIPLDLSQLENVFKNIDQTKQGQMGIEDWQKFLNNLGLTLSKAEVSRVMKIAWRLMQYVGVPDTSLLDGIGVSVPDENNEDSAGSSISGDETKEEQMGTEDSQNVLNSFDLTLSQAEQMDTEDSQNVLNSFDLTISQAEQMGTEDSQNVLNSFDLTLSQTEVFLACGSTQQVGVSVVDEDNEPSASTTVIDGETKDESIDATLIENLTLNEDPSTLEQK